MHIKQIVFAIIPYLCWFVHKIDLSLMLTLVLLIIMTGCFLKLVAGCRHVQKILINVE